MAEIRIRSAILNILRSALDPAMARMGFRSLILVVWAQIRMTRMTSEARFEVLGLGFEVLGLPK